MIKCVPNLSKILDSLHSPHSNIFYFVQVLLEWQIDTYSKFNGINTRNYKFKQLKEQSIQRNINRYAQGTLTLLQKITYTQKSGNCIFTIFIVILQ